MKSRLKKFTSMALLILLLNACGFDESEYEPYESAKQTAGEDGAEDQTAEEGDGTPADCSATALAVFKVSISPAIGSTCSNCHSEEGHSLPFENGKDADNRSSLLGWSGADADKIFEYISSPNHPGGNQAQALPLAKIKSWTDAEQKCSS
jgi:hypothetical protein